MGALDAAREPAVIERQLRDRAGRIVLKVDVLAGLHELDLQPQAAGADKDVVAAGNLRLWVLTRAGVQHQ